MCAAPGSKTTQILEVITNYHSLQCGVKDNTHSDSSLKPGFIIANDSNTDRAYMLVHQCRRLCSPYLMVFTVTNEYHVIITILYLYR